MINKRLTSRIIVILLLTLIAAQTGAKHLFGLNDSRTILSSPNQSFPTRTPVPGSNPTKTPAPKPTSSGGDNGSATAVPTSTSQSSPADTATPPVTIAYTPVGGFVPTAESCGVPPTIKVQNPTNVRLGPGTNYPIVGQLVFLEVRFILGRAADAAWWLIQLDDGNTGWVADNIVSIQGYIGGVPIVPAPAINGQTPTPGTLWNPTPLPFCTVTPTATAVPSATPSPTTAVIAPTTMPDTNEVVVEAAESIPATKTQTAVPEPTQTAVAPPTLPPAPPTSQPEVITAAQAAVDPIESAPTGSAADWLLPAAGLLLVAGGAVTFITRRRTKDQ
jgi:LPXTG-motif cell wall-anchored protein